MALTEEQRQAAEEAWDNGWETAARCYWDKPHNPYAKCATCGYGGWLDPNTACPECNPEEE